jgi:DNA repair protein RecO (recombination protein O)
MIQRTEAVTLKTQNWSESSRIVHVFTSGYGRIKLIARGVRRPKSRYGAAFEPGTLSQIVFYRSRSSELHTVSEADVIFRPGDPPDLDVHHYLALGLEIVYKSTGIDSPNVALFNNLLTLIKNLECGGREASLAAFCLAASNNLGYHPVLDRCLGCRKQAGSGEYHFSLEHGGLVCGACAKRFSGIVSLDRSLLQALSDWEKIQRLPELSKDQGIFLIKLIAEYINHHLTGHSRLTSVKYIT